MEMFSDTLVETSQRSLSCADTLSHPRKTNGSTQLRTWHRPRESLMGNCLVSLKTHYRKLSTFKGTIKALVGFQRLSKCSSRTASLVAATPLVNQTKENEESTQRGESLCVAEAVAKLTNDDVAFQTVQNQVRDLVEKGSVVTELADSDKSDVTYRMQGNLAHYSEANLRKRLELQEHPHMVALTQRLWVSAVHNRNETHLRFGAYEAFMLRLHRLILPEFDLAQSTKLIRDDWLRDTDGSDALNYRFFHLSMFELVDLWTDTVEAEDYISLLYCIMHSLTFECHGHHLLKNLDDINPVDIMEAAKEMTMEAIEIDMSWEVSSDDAQLYRDCIANENGVVYEGCGTCSEGRSTNPRRISSSDENSRTSSTRLHVTPPSCESGDRAIVTSGDLSTSVSPLSEDITASQTVDTTKPSSAQRRGSSNLIPQRSTRSRVGARMSVPNIRPHTVFSPPSGDQYAGGVNSETPPIETSSHWPGGDYINMVSKLAHVRRPSAVASGLGSRPQSGRPDAADRDQADSSLGLLGLTNGPADAGDLQTFEQTLQTQSNEAMPPGFHSPIKSDQRLPTRRSTFVSPRSPQSPRVTIKENELRRSSLHAGSERYQAYAQSSQGQRSPRVRSTRSNALSPPSTLTPPVPLSEGTNCSTERPTATSSSMPPLSAVPLDLNQLKPSTSIDPTGLMIGGGIRSSSRTSVFTAVRPLTSSPPPQHAALIAPADDLESIRQSRAYPESPSSPMRPASRNTRVYNHVQTSASAVTDWTALSLGGQHLHTGSRRVSLPAQSAAGSPQQLAFDTAGVDARTQSFDANPVSRSPTPRAAMAKIGQFPSSRRGDGDLDHHRMNVDLRLSGAPARLSSQNEKPLSLSPAPKMK